MLYNINKRLYLFEKGREEMAEVNVKKSSFFKEKKEVPNTDFSLLKGALIQNLDRLEKFVEAIPYKYIKEGNVKENA
ncbi:hypothetical protein BAS2315 [Bacillus anthracis str. Sterne]|uniref:Stage II sporulation protein SB n=2 Tax=Bacillus anthracis TaxID=1392 RepID=SP2SB_BACAN|nr:stage II sporulation protein SB [Bacillus anthracis]Q81QD4.1 RecName: Full=Stage II sporulation protein SB; AltName: Full=Antidote protein SpoIISB; AltName: Full=Antitoxin SpoIISB [Bacillus anthracis]AAP26353.1 hypothetical protein BA_2492 [Bacillus anthracis str. Ames]AAT31605.1 hypothetical protein GBAA_2492 [Bacillus anthracis str. 'Ames Ancestor']AAT54627.1 hypothetical protein BAS2315 [Bacillus anthracis str. Sterne]WIG04944.1 stage II sporulation protein SB [Bacillus anthracis]BAR767